MTVWFAWICAGVAAIATLGAAYFFDRSAEEGIEHAKHDAALANKAAATAHERANSLEAEAAKSNERATALEVEAARTRERAASLEKQAEEARADIANANARALQAQAELARFKAPRIIAPDRNLTLVTALSKLAGTQAAVYVLAEGPEATGLGFAIRDALLEAKWQAAVWHWGGAGAANGVIVFYKPGSEAETGAACDALASELNLSLIHI